MIYQMTTFTTQYSPLEDRLVLSTKLADGGQAKLFLTRRLLTLLLPKLDATLLTHYEKQASRPAEQLAAETASTQQTKQKAGSDGQAQKPVEVPAEVESTLIAGASIHPSENGLILALSTEERDSDPKSEYRVALTFENLHAWINIARALADKVEWQLVPPSGSGPDLGEGGEKPKAGWH